MSTCVDRFYLPKSLVTSKAFKSLTKTSTTVYINFRLKCTVQKPHNSRARDKPWLITNNGQLVYTYSEAKKEEISGRSFTRAIDELVEKGFIDIAHSGSGIKGDVSFYAISDRWAFWGAADFVERRRKKDRRRGRGFCR